MSLAINNIATLQAIFKQTFADEVVNMIPEREMLLRSIPFVSAEKQNGADYNQPVILSRHHGVTYLGSNDNNLQITPPIAARVRNASIRGTGKLMAGILSYSAASRAVKGGPAFIDATSYLVEGLMDSFSAVHEQEFWYGGLGLATLAAGGDLSGVTLTVPAAQWAPALWVGAEGMVIDVFSSAGAKKATVSVEAVDITNRQVIFQSVTGWTAATGDVLFRQGARGLEAIGFQSIMQTDGSVFGIDNQADRLWKGSRYDVNGQFSFSKVAEGVAIAYSRGLEGQLDLHVNPTVFAGLIPDFLTSRTDNAANSTDTAAATAGRQFNDSTEVERLRHGSKALRFIVNNVELNLIANDYVKGSLGMGVANQTWLRVGSSDITFDMPGASDSGAYFKSLDGYAGLELRIYSDQALFCKSPARNILFTGITP